MKNMRLMICLALFLSAISLSGCIQAPPPTAQQLEMQQQVISAFVNRINNAQIPVSGYQQREYAAPPAPTYLSESELEASILKFKNITHAINFTRHRDGFDVNGVRYVDPEGVIVSYGFDNMTGDVTYIAQTGPRKFIIKYTRALSGQSPVVLGTADKDGYQWTVVTVTGKRLVGESLTPLSKGFLMARDTSGFIYEPGKDISSFAAPPGFFVASFQNGDILRTRYVLVEKEPLAEDNKLGGLFENVKTIGANLGINKKEDYLLLNIDTGGRISINVDSLGKNVSVGRNCRKKNAIVNECEKIDLYESLFERTGIPNGSHYFWCISWFKGESGVILLTKENFKVTAKNIDLNAEVVAFERTLGVNWMTAEQVTSGKINVKAQLGFSEKFIEDIEKLFSAPEA